MIEAKKEGGTLRASSRRREVRRGPPGGLPACRPLPFSTSPPATRPSSRTPRPGAAQPRGLLVPPPETLAAWLAGDPCAGPGRPDAPPPPRPHAAARRNGLWPAQFTAIQNLERSLARRPPARADPDGDRLRQDVHRRQRRSTGSSSSADARRVLFLVDRANLGEQTLKEFQGFATPGRQPQVHRAVQRPAPDLEHASTPSRKVVITTIQRLYSMLKGEPELDPRSRGGLRLRAVEPRKEPLPVVYNPRLPPEFFDFIFVDECHRSIYTLWRQVLEYFDAFLIGLTATPAQADLRLLQPEPRHGVRPRAGRRRRRQRRLRRLPHPHARSPSRAATLEADRADGRRTATGRPARSRWELLDEDLTYDGRRSSTATSSPSDQIRTVVRDVPRPSSSRRSSPTAPRCRRR